MSHDVFVSHSSKDKPTADAIVAALEQRGARCWIAPRDIPPGATWGAAIIAGLEGSRVMVLVFSSKADASPQVLREVERAVAKGVTIVPVRIEDVTMSKDMEYFLAPRHWLDAIEQPLEPQLERVATSICGILQTPAGGAARGPSDPVAARATGRRHGWRAAAAVAGICVAAGLLLAIRPWAKHDAAPSSVATTAPATTVPATRPQAPAAVLPLRYVVTDLGTLGGEESESGAAAINDAGQVAGDTDVVGPFVDGHPRHHAFLWAGEKMIDLGTLGGPNSSATAMNGRGQIAGVSDTNDKGEPHAFLYDNGKMTDLGTLGGKTSEAYGINAAGDIVGKTDTAETGEDGPVARAFLYRAGKMTDLGAWGRRCSEARAINDAGRIAGDVFDRNPNFTPFVLDVATGSGSAWASSPAPATPRRSTRPAMSPGRHNRPKTPESSTLLCIATAGATTWERWAGRSVMVTASTHLAGCWAPVRVASASDTRLHAFLADNAGLHDLNRMVSADARCVLTAVRSANSSGTIVGEADFATGRHAVVLTPDSGGR